MAADRPACWAKIPAVLDAFERSEWVLWADSDTLVMNPERGLEEFCDPAFDLVVASQEEFFRRIGVPPAEGLARMPINTGVFLMRGSEWSKELLRGAWEERQFISHGAIWNGIGEQEAMIHLLQQQPAGLARIKYVAGLQNHPKLYREGDLFLHFYGNHARHRVPVGECEEVFARWEAADASGGPLPEDRCRFHWCSIQNKEPQGPMDRGDLARYLYEPQDIEPFRLN